jgi:hypothetical protein
LLNPSMFQLAMNIEKNIKQASSWRFSSWDGQEAVGKSVKDLKVVEKQAEQHHWYKILASGVLLKTTWLFIEIPL